MSFTRKVGRKIQRPGGMVCEVAAVGDLNIALKGSDGRLYIIQPNVYCLYDDVKEFFKVGKEYKFQTCPEAVWAVRDLYRVDNPAPHDGKDFAVALRTNGDGYQSIDVLSEVDFLTMTEVN